LWKKKKRKEKHVWESELCHRNGQSTKHVPVHSQCPGATPSMALVMRKWESVAPPSQHSLETSACSSLSEEVQGSPGPQPQTDPDSESSSGTGGNGKNWGREHCSEADWATCYYFLPAIPYFLHVLFNLEGVFITIHITRFDRFTYMPSSVGVVA